ncbi:alpha/beta fold hydrolase [Mesorhizobium sp. M0340]|uniref:alpha/beta fold hydrolase n=1 Tax=Mesorhizobium sp. M0340 TaxID=2956939 RepID=UPI00333A35FF
MWRDIAAALAPRFTVVAADLRGYGQSGCPVSSADHSPYAKRAMAGDMVQAMKQLGFERFMVAGHDRGGRVAYRVALDHPDKVLKIAVLDIIPTAATWDRADARLALGFWPWSLLAQPEPLPERLIGAAPDAVVDDAITQWGSSAKMVSKEVRDAYVDALRDPAHIHGICEEYRAAATIDREHDALGRGKRSSHRVSATGAMEWRRRPGELVHERRRAAGYLEEMGRQSGRTRCPRRALFPRRAPRQDRSGSLGIL